MLKYICLFFDAVNEEWRGFKSGSTKPMTIMNFNQPTSPSSSRQTTSASACSSRRVREQGENREGMEVYKGMDEGCCERDANNGNDLVSFWYSLLWKEGAVN